MPIDETFKRIASAYDQCAETWDEMLNRRMIAQIREYEIDLFAETLARIDHHSDPSILDAGMGTGRLEELLKHKQGIGQAAKWVGYDLAEGMLQAAKRKGITSIVQANACFMPFPNDSFDGCLSQHMLSLVPSDILSEAFGEVNRILKPGGALAFSVFTSEHKNAEPAFARLYPQYREKDRRDKMVPLDERRSGQTYIDVMREFNFTVRGFKHITYDTIYLECVKI